MNHGIDRIPPQSLEAEMAVIGAALIDAEARDIVVDLLVPADFYAHVHESIFASIAALTHAGKPVDQIALATHLRDRGHLDNVGGLPYLTSLMDQVPTAASAEYYAQLVREKALLRALIRAGGEIADLGFTGETDVAGAIAKSESAFTRAIDRGVKAPGGSTIAKLLAEHYWRLGAIAAGDVKIGGIVTPWRELNAMIGPSKPGHLVLWVAAAGMGKTGVMLTLADWFSAQHEAIGQTALFTLEMSAEEITARQTAMYSNISVRTQNKSPLTEFELEKIATGISRLGDRRLTVFDMSNVSSLADIRRELRLLSRDGPIGAIVVDGVNFIADVDNRANGVTKNDRMDYVYKSLKRFASEFRSVMHAAQHVNREGMSGPPTLKDIRDGGNAEGTANVVIAPYRPKPLGTAEERREGKFIVLKARDGDAGIVEGMEFIGHRAIWVEGGTAPWFEPQPEAEPDLFAGAI